MNIFKKFFRKQFINDRERGKKEGKGIEKTKMFYKEFDVLNYTPVDYRLTSQYAEFISDAEARVHAHKEKQSAGSLWDADKTKAYIDARIQQMKSYAKEQYTHHMYIILHHKGLLEGELVHANGHVANLEEDLKAVEEKIEKYKKLKKERNMI